MMKKQTKVILCSVAIVAVLNMVLPKLLAPFATAEEKAPAAGAKNLSFKGQLMHMLVHHSHVPVSSSVLVGVLVAIAVCVAMKIC